MSGGELLAWLWPAIGTDAFEVGAEVRAAFLALDPAVGSVFWSHGEGKFLAEIHLPARRRMAGVGVTAVYGGGCTVAVLPEDMQALLAALADNARGADTVGPG